MNLKQLIAELLGFFSVGAIPQIIGILAEAAETVNKRGGGAAALIVDSRGCGSAGETANVRITCSIDDYLSKYRTAAFLGLKEYTLAGIPPP